MLLNKTANQLKWYSISFLSKPEKKTKELTEQAIINLL